MYNTPFIVLFPNYVKIGGGGHNKLTCVLVSRCTTADDQSFQRGIFLTVPMCAMGRRYSTFHVLFRILLSFLSAACRVPTHPPHPLFSCSPWTAPVAFTRPPIFWLFVCLRQLHPLIRSRVLILSFDKWQP